MLLVLLSCKKDDENTLTGNTNTGNKTEFIENNSIYEFLDDDYHFDFISNSEGIIFVSDETGNQFISYEEIELPGGSCYLEMDNKSYSTAYAFWHDLSGFSDSYRTEIVIVDRNYAYAISIFVNTNYDNITVGNSYYADAYFNDFENYYYVKADYAFVKFLKANDEKLSGEFEFYYNGFGIPESGIQSDSKTIKGTFYYLTGYNF